MKRKIITTKDGSKTIQIEEWNEQYHSVHGAINEANHVFIKHGLLYFLGSNQAVEVEDIDANNALDTANEEIVSILEIGFGTGLNAFLTALKAEAFPKTIHYTGVEAYPVKANELIALNYATLTDGNRQDVFQAIHASKWECQQRITSNFKLTKQQKFFADITDINTYDIIYFDAFGARVQPELWSEAIFKKMYDALKVNGVLVTYAAIGRVKRLMQDLGFTVERLQGPPGKRHMLRARKEIRPLPKV